MRLTRTVAPAIEPLTLDELRDHLRVDVNDEDAGLDRYLASARSWLEETNGIALIEQTHVLELDVFPRGGGPILLPFPPLLSVTTFAYTDVNGSPATLTEGVDFEVDTAFGLGRLRPLDGGLWPQADSVYNAVSITFKAGHGSTRGAIPEELRLVLLQLAAHFYEHRGGEEAIPAGILRLADPHRAFWRPPR